MDSFIYLAGKMNSCAALMAGLLAGFLVLSLCFGDIRGRSLSLEERVASQNAIEQVYWSHRIWPKENPGPKPALSAVLSDDAIRSRVEDYLKKSNALEAYWQRTITDEQLQGELDRMAAHTRAPQVLKELFAALGNDPHLIGETLARSTLADRLVRTLYANDARFHGELRRRAEAALGACQTVGCMRSLGSEYRETTWKVRSEGVEAAEGELRQDVLYLDDREWRAHLVRLAMTFGSRADSLPVLQMSGLEETPEAFIVTAVLSQGQGEVRTAVSIWPKVSFDDWWAAQRPTLPIAIQEGAASLTLPTTASSGCIADTWEPTSLGYAPNARSSHLAVWTGAEMIIWGGADNTGGRYDPSTDTWTPTSTGVNTPNAVGGEPAGQTAVWTGTEMVVWGGGQDNADCYCTGIERFDDPVHGPACEGNYYCGEPIPFLNPGGRYNPLTDTWTPTSTGANVPEARYFHTAVWTGTEMIVWGGTHVTCYYLEGDPLGCDEFPLTSGGRYKPSTDTWTPTSTGANVPDGRIFQTAVWTGTEMIVWGGEWQGISNSGGRYDPSLDTWTPTSTGASVPTGRTHHTAVWTGTEMIVWGGQSSGGVNTGGIYEPSTDTWTQTSTGANVPTGRFYHTAVWTGTEMIVWGGYNYGSNPSGYLNTGGHYDPSADTWVPTSSGPSVPSEREGHTAVWTGTQMIVWGGNNGSVNLNDGGLYCACLSHTLSYRDADGDGYGDPAVVSATCDGTIPAGYVANHTDCNDASALVNPGAIELCNGIDDDCDGSVDDAGLCDDGNLCTTDSCNPATGCVHTDNANACDDGNVCTDDSCNPASGCVHVNNSGSCDDGDACTTNDTCSSGSCVGGSPPNCEDANPCTNDSCDSQVGCVNADNGICTDHPKRRKFWRKVYRGLIPGEAFTQVDLECIQDSCLFTEIETQSDIFDKLSRGSEDDLCLQAESQLMALVINVCRHRISPDRIGHVSCSDQTTVGAMKSEAESMMCTPNPMQDQCHRAKCIAARINAKRL